MRSDIIKGKWLNLNIHFKLCLIFRFCISPILDSCDMGFYHQIWLVPFVGLTGPVLGSGALSLDLL